MVPGVYLGNQLTIDNDGEISVATVLEVTATTLKLSYRQTEESIVQGFKVTTFVDVIMTYTRM
ncbi:hypothetical protein N7U66_02805 [Lacinutrix neustonica]|uniref:Uncharacterized protein n=1 Tax=Lacinutrix neustonica TaxID=2980107 RepID=A0A9E8MW74_9FLAO|nr:hypothetical protein [Lacinutrix neustonica]WAC02633.1 hypothetical protein N7U66_02805 [Lacinutrix neustonica]